MTINYTSVFCRLPYMLRDFVLTIVQKDEEKKQENVFYIPCTLAKC